MHDIKDITHAALLTLDPAPVLLLPPVKSGGNSRRSSPRDACMVVDEIQNVIMLLYSWVQ
jgi:hypothetical protein